MQLFKIRLRELSNQYNRFAALDKLRNLLHLLNINKVLKLHTDIHINLRSFNSNLNL